MLYDTEIHFSFLSLYIWYSFYVSAESLSLSFSFLYKFFYSSAWLKLVSNFVLFTLCNFNFMHYTFPLFVRLAHHSSFLHTHSTIHFAQYRSNAKHFQQHHSNSPFQKNEIFHSDFIFERPHSISVHSHNKPLYLNFPKPQILPAHPAACMLYHSHNRTRVPPWHLFLMPYIYCFTNYVNNCHSRNAATQKINISNTRHITHKSSTIPSMSSCIDGSQGTSGWLTGAVSPKATPDHTQKWLFVVRTSC